MEEVPHSSEALLENVSAYFQSQRWSSIKQFFGNSQQRYCINLFLKIVPCEHFCSLIGLEVQILVRFLKHVFIIISLTRT